MMNKSKGFSLIELMITVAVLAIIVTVAIPSYRSYIERTNRTDGTRALMETAQALERCFSRFNAYNSNDCPVTFPITSDEGFYEITGQVQAGGFTLTATPQGGQANDTRCAAFTLTHTQVRGVSGTATAEDCW